jgi:membrane-associated phospholipid phosphatase
MEIQRNIGESFKNKTYIRPLLTIASLIVFFVLVISVQSSKTLWMDQAMLNFSKSFISGNLYDFFSFLTNLGSKPVVIAIFFLTLVLIWWKTKDYLAMITIAAVLLGSNELFKALKDIFQRERPIYEPSIDAIGYSFPSGHSTVSMAFYGIIMYFLWKYMKTGAMKSWSIYLLSLYILLIGMSRVLLQAHYISDVFAGFAIGFVYLMIWISIYEISNKYLLYWKAEKSEFTM